MTSIGNHAFSGCTGLTSVTISDIAAWCNIEFDGVFSNPLYYAHHFYVNGKEVKDLVIPYSVTSIRNYAFYSYSSLTSISIPNNVTSIGHHAFSYCSGLTSISIGNGVKSIGEFAFSSCLSLTSLSIGSGIKQIEAGAFGHCQNLSDVYCYATNVPTVNASAFNNSYIEYAKLHVPSESLNSYKSITTWKDFGTILALTDKETGVLIIEAMKETMPIYYHLNGQQVAKPSKGINIIRMNDGSTKKIAIK